MRDDAMKNALLPLFSTEPSGRGLGLPLCREIVEVHGATLSIGRGRVGD
jgi:two-component system, NtrC family, nitrogen regulation sensor histidine kinase NtrY